MNKAQEFFTKHNLQAQIKEFDTSSATSEMAANAIGCSIQQIAKTLSFKYKDKCLLLVAAGDAKIDNPKFKAQFETKASMLSPQEVTDMLGYTIGGVCPFAIDTDIPVYLDVSLKRFSNVYTACGSCSSVIKLTIEQLQSLSGAICFVDVCKAWQEN